MTNHSNQRDYLSLYHNWLNADWLDEQSRNELQALANDNEIEDRFYQDLAFGTGGLRGVMGVGTNRMNIYTVGKATQGLADYLNATFRGITAKVAIAYDSRHSSAEFALRTALVLNGNGIQTYLYPALRTTGQLSFTVRQLGCQAGVMITASHNPKEYNGYKLYDETGCQVTAPVDKQIINYVNAVASFETVKTVSQEQAISTGLFHWLDETLDERFLAYCQNLSIHQTARELSIVYTPLHGTGYGPVKQLLRNAGFVQTHFVTQQIEPDGDFPTAPYPNPEEPEVFELAIQLGNQVDADLLLATDPDADRLGAMVRDNQGDFVMLTGNMIGCLLAEYLMSQKQQQGILTERSALVSTIVSTDMGKAITKRYGVQYHETLTGFKYIGELMNRFETEQSSDFVLGFEESYGYLAGNYARDKDAVGSLLLLCEAAAFYKKNKGLSLYQVLQQLYQHYGYYQEKLLSVTLKGSAGAQKIQSIMANLATTPPTQVAGVPVDELRDYRKGLNSLPAANVLYFVLADKSWFCLRPSGTEPKIKLYMGVVDATCETAQAKLKRIEEAVTTLIFDENR